MYSPRDLWYVVYNTIVPGTHTTPRNTMDNKQTNHKPTIGSLYNPRAYYYEDKLNKGFGVEKAKADTNNNKDLKNGCSSMG